MESAIITNTDIPNTYKDQIDATIAGFAKSVVGVPVDPYDLDRGIERAVTDTCRGREIIRTLQQDDLNKFIDEIIKYKQVKDSILATKKMILDDYNFLKSIMMDEMRKNEARALGIEDIRNPDYAMLRNTEYQRFANVNTELTRMFNAFIKIYKKAFDTKLNILKDRIDENQAILTRLMQETNVFAAINPHNPSRYKKPQKFGPKIKA
jgi:integrase